MNRAIVKCSLSYRYFERSYLFTIDKRHRPLHRREKGGQVEPYHDKQKRKLNLSFTESALVQHMTPYSAHTDDLAQLSSCELLPEEVDSISYQYGIHNNRRED